MTKLNTGTIYALDDPRDGSTRYIGKTTQDPLERLAGHLAAATNPAMRVWINALGAQGIVPRIRTLRTVAIDKLDGEEKRQIERHAKAGHRLLNAPYYHRNLSDLLLPVGPIPDNPTEKTANRSAPRIAFKVYGPIANNWAANRISPWRAAALVILLSPIVSAVIVFRALAGIRGGKQVFLACAMGFYFWKIGFSRLVRDFVFPRLPVNEFVQFWHQYLEQPMWTFGWNTLAGVLVMGLMSYIPVADAASATRSRNSHQGRDGLTSSEVAAQAAAALDRALDHANPRALPPARP